LITLLGELKIKLNYLYGEETMFSYPYQLISVRPRPTTIWNVFDYFIMDLGEFGDAICKEPRLNDDYYMGLVSLVCEGKEDALKFIEGKPYYPFILIAYYILFHKHDLGLAKKVMDKISDYKEKSPYSFDDDERCTSDMLDYIIYQLDKMRSQKPQSLLESLRFLADWISNRNQYKCLSRGWGELFRLLLLSHLDPNNVMNYLNKIKETILMEQRRTIPDDIEIIRHYKIKVSDVAISPMETFILGIVERRLKALNETALQIETLSSVKKAFEEQKNYFEKEKEKIIKEQKKRERKFFRIEREVLKVPHYLELMIGIGTIGSISTFELFTKLIKWNWIYGVCAAIVFGTLIILVLLIVFSRKITESKIKFIDEKIKLFGEIIDVLNKRIEFLRYEKLLSDVREIIEIRENSGSS